MRPTLLVAVLAGICAAGQLGLIIWAAATGGSVVSALVAMGSAPWGLTTLTDLGLGLAISGLWITLLERSTWRAVLWWIALCLLGNLTTALFVAWRCATHRSLSAALLGHPESP